LKTLLRLQDLDLRIEALKAREVEIPKQKGKFEIHHKRLVAELAEREKVCKSLLIEQHECEAEIDQKQNQIKKYEQQLFSVKKNEEYQALLHEIDMIKKQIGLKEERVIAIMVELDGAKARLEEDKKRIDAELKDIDRQRVEIDAELREAVGEREQLERERAPLVDQVRADLLSKYQRIRASKGSGPAVVPLNGEACSGCHMRVTPQIFNEILAGTQQHACSYCGRLLYHPDNFRDEPATG
jgi:predicted  nucleic acid-binding Zn-ribbon protein